MLIDAVIEKIKSYYKGTLDDGTKIDDATSRDQVLFGTTDVACTGIVTTCFASVDVVKAAIEKGANLIICHEALFWNRGDRTDWLDNNEIFKQKVQLMKDHGIVVWRNHDYIHTGIPLNESYVDGIFYGVADKLDWHQYYHGMNGIVPSFRLPNFEAKEVASHLIDKLGLNGLRLIGDPNTTINKIEIAPHIMGPDNDVITNLEENNIDALIALEVIDYTVSEYVRDSSQLGLPKVIFSVGHFNLEEPGMEYMLEYLPELFDNKIPIYFEKSGDTFEYQLV